MNNKRTTATRTPSAAWGRALKAVLCALAALGLPAAGRAETVTAEPDAFLDYIEATGSQYIDTGVNAETGLKARIDFECGAYSGNVDWGFLDAAGPVTSTSDDRSRIFMCHLYNYKPFFGYGLKQRGNPSGTFTISGGVRYEIVADMTDTNSLELVQNGKNTFSAGDREKYAVNGNNVDLNLNLFVFATNYGGDPTWYGKGKLYELKIWKKNATTGELDLIRHYLPCIKGGRAGLYDKVNGTISYSFKSGSDFVAGPVLDKPLDFVKWIWTNGKQWFDTRVWGKSGLKSEVDVSVREYSGDRCILGTRRSNNRYYPAYSYEAQFRYAYGTMPLKGNTTVVAPTNDVSYYMDTRYFIKSDLRDGYQSVLVSKNGGTPVELHKDDQAYLTGENVVTNTMALMACHTDNSYVYPSKGLVYRTTIWDGDEILRDFVPVVATNSSGVAYAGLYDTVTERIYRQIGTEEFNLATQVGAVTNSLRTAIAPPTTRLEYVDSDELLDYVNLGVIGKDGIEMDAVMEWLRVPNDGAFVGARTDTKNNHVDGKAGIRIFPYHHWIKDGSGHRFGYDGQIRGNGAVAVAGTKYRISSHLDNGDQNFSVSSWVDGGWAAPIVVNTAYPGSVDTELPLYLFAVDFDGVARYPGKVRVYSLKFREKQQDGSYALVRDLIPVRDPATGAPVLWDKVTETYFRNGGKYLLAGGGEERPIEAPFVLTVR